LLGEVECDEDAERVDDDFRDGDGQLNFTRNLPVADTPVVFEGFGAVMLGVQRQITGPVTGPREKAPARYDRLLQEILVKLGLDPATIPRGRGGAHSNETKRLAKIMAMSDEYAGQGFTDKTFKGAWERLPKKG